MDPDPGHFFKIHWIFWTKDNFQIFCYFFFVYFYPNTWWTIQTWGYFYNLFSKVQSRFIVIKKFFFCSFWLIFYLLEQDPWISIFLRIRIQEAKILRIQWIRILSTDSKVKVCHLEYNLLMAYLMIRQRKKTSLRLQRIIRIRKRRYKFCTCRLWSLILCGKPWIKSYQQTFILRDHFDVGFI